MAPHTTRWGILATGWISTKFALDLLVDPSTREVSDVKHRIVAVGSRSKDSAAGFVDKVWQEAGRTEGKDQVSLYGSYEELVNDANIDCIYVGTPHSHHYANVHLALSAGKNVLCEKALTVNVAQAEVLVKLAREKNLFLMEAVWTRFQPYAYKLQEVIRSGAIGSIRGFAADLCIDFTRTVTKDPSHRIYNPVLAGGALLDLGPYMWVHAALLLLPESKASLDPLPVPKITAGMVKTESGVDQSTVAVIEFPQPGKDGQVVQATLTCAQDRESSRNRVVLVQGTKGYLEVQAGTYRPAGFTYHAWDSEEDYGTETKEATKTETYSFAQRPGNIWGFAWEADEVARCLRDGKKESDRMPLRETILQMQVFDEIRRQGDFRYPEELETLDLA
ncbi:hypothetical protein JCM11641_007709 [Rhodosporidiobolus odoratus]